MREVEAEAIRVIYSYMKDHEYDKVNPPWVNTVRYALKMLKEAKPARAIQHITYWVEEERKQLEGT